MKNNKFENNNDVEEEKNNQNYEQDFSNDLVKKINKMMRQNPNIEDKINFSLLNIRQKSFDSSLKIDDLNYLDDLIVPYEEIFDKIKI